MEEVAQDLLNRDEALKQLKYHLHQAQDQMRKYADKHRRPSPIQVGDMVFLKIRPHRQHSLTTKLHPKLAARYYGPFLVLAKVGEVAFKLQLPENALIHLVFHVSQLKRAIGQQSMESELPQDLQLQGPTSLPLQILDKRVVDNQGESVQQILV